MCLGIPFSNHASHLFPFLEISAAHPSMAEQAAPDYFWINLLSMVPLKVAMYFSAGTRDISRFSSENDVSVQEFFFSAEFSVLKKPHDRVGAGVFYFLIAWPVSILLPKQSLQCEMLLPSEISATGKLDLLNCHLPREKWSLPVRLKRKSALDFMWTLFGLSGEAKMKRLMHCDLLNYWCDTYND